MNSPATHLVDLPNEILLIILKKLDNMNVLYSLIGIGVERLDLLAKCDVFTNTLNFTSTGLDKICSNNDSILDQFRMNILPQIHYNVRYLIIEATTIERIALATDYPNLTKLKIYKFNKDLVSYYVTDKSTFGRIFKEQITDLTLISDEKFDKRFMIDYTINVCAPIINFCKNLKYFNADQSYHEDCQPVSFRDLPSTIFFSSTLTKLSIAVDRFEGCLCLLDGRLEHLTSLSVTIGCFRDATSMVFNSNNLRNLKCFSLTYMYLTFEYDTQVVPLLRRMCNLEELTLNLYIADRVTFVDGVHLYDDILIHLPQLHTFIFHIRTSAKCENVVHLSSDDIQRTFTNIEYAQVGCIVNYWDEIFPICHVFSLPFAFDRFDMLSNEFPKILYKNVTKLFLFDLSPFQHELFLQIARFFPSLKSLRIFNSEPNTQKFKLDSNQSHSIVEYPYLTKLDVRSAHKDYIEQLLHESKTRLPQLQ